MNVLINKYFRCSKWDLPVYTNFFQIILIVVLSFANILTYLVSFPWSYKKIYHSKKYSSYHYLKFQYNTSTSNLIYIHHVNGIFKGEIRLSVSI